MTNNARRPQPDYKPESTYSPIGTMPEDDAETIRRQQQGASAHKRAEASAAELRPGHGLQLADDESRAAGGNRN